MTEIIYFGMDHEESNPIVLARELDRHKPDFLTIELGLGHLLELLLEGKQDNAPRRFNLTIDDMVIGNKDSDYSAFFEYARNRFPVFLVDSYRDSIARNYFKFIKFLLALESDALDNENMPFFKELRKVQNTVFQGSMPIPIKNYLPSKNHIFGFLPDGEIVSMESDLPDDFKTDSDIPPFSNVSNLAMSHNIMLLARQYRPALIGHLSGADHYSQDRAGRIKVLQDIVDLRARGIFDVPAGSYLIPKISN